MLKQSCRLNRLQFLEDRHKRLYPERYKGEEPQATTIDIESRDFIKRDESDGRILKFNINQPMLNYTASVARKVRQEDMNFEYDRLRTRWNEDGVKNRRIKPSLDANFISLAHQLKIRKGRESKARSNVSSMDKKVRDQQDFLKMDLVTL